MQHDIEPNEINWVFCWRTSTGEVRPGARDSGMSGRRVGYRPDAEQFETGLRTIVRRRESAFHRSPVGPRLDEQGAISRMSVFSWGHVTSPHLVLAPTMRELGALREAAHTAVLSGEAREWAFAALSLGKRACWAIHVAADPAIVTDIAKRVDAPWTLDIQETRAGSWVKGAQLFCRDLEGRVIETLEADTFFDEAPLPAFVLSWCTTSDGKPVPAVDPCAFREHGGRLCSNWHKDPEILKEEIFSEWNGEHPEGTREQFEVEWGVVAAIFGC